MVGTEVGILLLHAGFAIFTKSLIGLIRHVLILQSVFVAVNMALF